MKKTIFFDIGGVLLDIHPKHTLNYWANSLDLTVEQIKRTLSEDVHNAYEKGEITDRDYFLDFTERLPQHCCIKESEFWKGWSLLLGQETAANSVLRHLSKKHPIWLLSNTNPKHIKEELKNKASFLSYISGAIYSFEAGYRKPEQEIYDYALQKAETVAGESLFIDDVEININTAQNLGMKTIHYLGVDSLIEGLINLDILPFSFSKTIHA